MATTLIGGITDVWSAIMEWIVGSLGSVQSVFYAEGSLTFLGVLACISVAIGVAFLVIGVIQNFLRLRS